MPHRILIIGASGAGKSTLGRTLAQHLDVPYVEIDALHHGPNWQPATAQELLERVLRATEDVRGWVVDGSYVSKLGTVIADRAELIVWLDLPLSTKLRRLVRRTALRWLRNEALWNGNRETLRDAFWGTKALFPWAVRSHFRQRREWPELLAERPLVRLCTVHAVDAWLADFRAGAHIATLFIAPLRR